MFFINIPTDYKRLHNIKKDCTRLHWFAQDYREYEGLYRVHAISKDYKGLYKNTQDYQRLHDVT